MNYIDKAINCCLLCAYYQTNFYEEPCKSCKQKRYPKKPADELNIRRVTYVRKEHEDEL